jgi:shikimate 5-dehydrogenase
MKKNKIFGLLGEKLGHSYSKEIHENLFKSINFSGEYRLFEKNIIEIKDLVAQIKIGNLAGLNITIPYKEVILEYLDVLSEEVKVIGACNTIVCKDGNLYGYNTDYYGFKKTLERYSIDIKNKEVTILGAGGAAKAVIVYLLKQNCQITVISNKNSLKLKELKSKFPKIDIKNYNELTNIKGNILIQSTPVGMYPNINECIVSKEFISNYDIAIDLIYNPIETLFLKYANDLGLVAINGLDMLLDQALQSEIIWNDIKINEVERNKLYKQLRGKFE